MTLETVGLFLLDNMYEVMLFLLFLYFCERFYYNKVKINKDTPFDERVLFNAYVDLQLTRRYRKCQSYQQKI
jgi:hypothetical protein